MNSYCRIQTLLAIFMFITINVLFYFKYAYRVSFPAGIISVVSYIFFVFILFAKYGKIKTYISDKVIFVVTGLFVIACIITLFNIPKEVLRVDRWEMVQVFWDSVAKGLYPYTESSPISGNYPGPMPFYFVICYPFYLLGEMGFATVTGILIWLYYAYREYKNETFVLVALLLFSSLALYWEIFARSTVFLNASLFALYIFSLKDIKAMGSKQFYLSAMIGGFLFSTRNVFVLALIIWGLFALFREKIKVVKMLKWGLCFIASFIATFIPFILLNPSKFTEMNPFIIQSSVLMPFNHILFFVFLAFVFYFLCKKFTDVVFYSGLLLFLTIAWYMLFRLYNGGIQSYLDTEIDISYFIFCFPFLLEIIANKNDNDRQ